jgi:hypothetical protein
MIATFSIPNPRRRDLTSPDQALDRGGKQKNGSLTSSIDGSSVIVITAASKCSIVRPRCLLKMIPMNPMRKGRKAGCYYLFHDLVNRGGLPVFWPLPDYGDQGERLRCVEQIVPTEYFCETYSTDVNSGGAFA